jgi:hypothetical protein
MRCALVGQAGRCPPITAHGIRTAFRPGRSEAPLSEDAAMPFFSGAGRRTSLRSSSMCKSSRPHRSRAASPEPRCRSVAFTVISCVLAGATITVEIEAEPAAPLFIGSSEPPRASPRRSSFPVGEPRRSPLVKRHHSPPLVQGHCS